MTDDDDAHCPDGGTCHHICETGRCWRVAAHCGPLSGVYPGDEWPKRVLREHSDEVVKDSWEDY